MKKLNIIVLAIATLALAGCDNNKGGSSDQSTISSGTASSTNYTPRSTLNTPQGGALSPGDINSGAGSSKNAQGLDTNSVPDK